MSSLLMRSASAPPRRKLIARGLQLRLTAKFVGIAVLAMVLPFPFLGYRLFDAFEQANGRGGDLASHLPRLMVDGGQSRPSCGEGVKSQKHQVPDGGLCASITQLAAGPSPH